MKCDAGDTFSCSLHRCRFSDKTSVWEIFFATMAGVELMHAVRFIHRYIKPENVLRREDGPPVLLDLDQCGEH